MKIDAKLLEYRALQLIFLNSATEILGSKQALAGFLNIKPQALSRYFSKERELPENHWKKIVELVTGY